MNSTIEQWIDELVAGVDDAQASAKFQGWLDVQSRFHDYSCRNTLLIKRKCPEASRFLTSTRKRPGTPAI